MTNSQQQNGFIHNNKTDLLQIYISAHRYLITMKFIEIIFRCFKCVTMKNRANRIFNNPDQILHCIIEFKKKICTSTLFVK